eukprot:COSAG03_NODE_6657_length_1023_cov_2.602814_1_plen_198_part_00
MDPAGARTATELSIYALQIHAERSGPIPLPEPRDPAIHDAASDTTYNRKTRGSEGRSAHRGAACRRPARPRCCPQSVPSCRRAPAHPPPLQYPARRNVSAASTGVASQSAMRTQEGVRAEARTVELRAVAQLGRAAARSPAPPCRCAPTHPPPPQHPARRRMAQQAPPSPLRAASSRPTSRCGAAPARALACLCGAP